MRAAFSRWMLLLLLPAISASAQHKGNKSLYRNFFPKGECDSSAFAYAWRGYRVLLGQGLLANNRYLTIIDFTKASNAKRLFVLDIETRRIAIQSVTAHGVGSDPDSTAFAQRFSNHDGSRASSVGFYITGATYMNHRPRDSTGLCLFGLDKGYNDSAAAREIVVHYGATEYKGREYVTDSGAARSYGCPALPLSTNSKIIGLIKGGSCLFIYSDKATHYAAESVVLNGGVRRPVIQRGPPPNYCSCNLRPASTGH